MIDIEEIIMKKSKYLTLGTSLKKIKELQEHLLQEMPHLDIDSAYDMAEKMFEEQDNTFIDINNTGGKW